MDFSGRIARLAKELPDAEIDALLVTDLTNVRYLTGFSGTNGQLLVSPSKAVFFSDPRYAGQASDRVREAEVAIYPNRLTELLPAQLESAGVTRLGVEGKTMTLALKDDLAGALEPVELVVTKDLVENLRRVKEPAEVGLLREAAHIADAAFAWAVDRVAPGIAERDLALELEVKMRQDGAEGVSFEPIVGSGPLSAHIHHFPGERTLAAGDLVLLDFGAKVDGYCSDLTRTLSLGPPADDYVEMYELVLRAQAAGLDAIAAGVSGVDADAAARAMIEGAGHGDDFGHGLGHGVGLDVHEAPRLARTSEDTLLAGDVVTVEPGVYVVGRGGVRIEDCVLVTEDGVEVLGTAPKDRLLEV